MTGDTLVPFMLTIHPPKRFLFGPGPTQVEPRVYEAMSQPVVGYLDPYFFEVADDVKKGLQQVFGTTNEMTLAISARVAPAWRPRSRTSWLQGRPSPSLSVVSLPSGYVRWHGGTAPM